MNSCCVSRLVIISNIWHSNHAHISSIPTRLPPMGIFDLLQHVLMFATHTGTQAHRGKKEWKKKWYMQRSIYWMRWVYRDMVVIVRTSRSSSGGPVWGTCSKNRNDRINTVWSHLLHSTPLAHFLLVKCCRTVFLIFFVFSLFFFRWKTINKRKWNELKIQRTLFHLDWMATEGGSMQRAQLITSEC